MVGTLSDIINHTKQTTTVSRHNFSGKNISLSFRDEHLGYNQEKTFCINALGIYK